ncbi:MAG TPA: transaldolase family protein [Bacteroidia bacterium]|nr:transaldolase family protein [Bacteroidia bacterium]HRS58877.1 transaldolase family protein [Bacteroidia bacterium]
MELYLDSVDLNEIEQAFSLGFLTGLTTTPTFMHRQGIKNIDEAIVKLSEKVPVLQLEAIGESSEDIIGEAERLLSLGLNPGKTVFKIPVSFEGVKACKKLIDKGLLVNIHLVYTIQQAYMAMAAGATYICPLVGRLQDQGQDALGLIDQCVSAVNYYGYSSKIMFSSVRNIEHVKNAINLGVHACTMPWYVLKNLTQNSFTTLGTNEFLQHSRLLNMKAGDVIRRENPVVKLNDNITEAIKQMTSSGLGAVSVVDESGKLTGIFTDGDLRRNLGQFGEQVFMKKMAELAHPLPVSVESDTILQDVIAVFKERKIDNIIVTQSGKPIGMIDIQDITDLKLL